MNRLIVFDGDDTLWQVEHLYDKARDRAARVVARAGLDPHRWSRLQREIDVASVPDLGLSPLRFPSASVVAYERVAAEMGRAVDDSIKEEIRRASASVFDATAPLVPGAQEVLEELLRTHRLALLTQGDPLVQEKRIADSGLRAAFEIIHVVPCKNEDSFSAVLAEANMPASDAWSVGNSLPSDINPALRLGMSAIWIDAHVWDHERREAHPEDGRFFVCTSLREVPSIIQHHTVIVG
jgi:putative hydrolase of the HAD superfamily